jgi:hypothetical protein
MAVILFKDGESKRFDENTFQDRLKEGWSFDPDGKDTISVDPVEDSVCKDEEVILAVDNMYTTALRKNLSYPGYGMGSGPNDPAWIAFENREYINGLSNKKVRKEAKKAGIKNFAKARVETLRQALMS